MLAASATILLVEDDPNDVFFLQYAFEQAGIKNPIRVVCDGQEAINYLAGNGKFADRLQYPIPALLLLDLKLPVLMGLDVLRWIKEQAELQTIIVIVMTSSKEPTDIQEAYRLGARSYLVKPLSVQERLEIAKAIKSYWLGLNTLPSRITRASTAHPANG